MSRNTGGVLIQIDSWILDNIFQPLTNRLPGEKMNLRLGTNLVFGSVVFSFAFLLLPMIMFGIGVFASTYNVLACVMNICFYMYVHQKQSLVREGFINPLRYYLFGMRVISVVFAVYGIYVWMASGGMVGFFRMLYCISNILSVCGLYLISCNLNPPKKKEERKIAFAGNPFA